MIGVAQTPAVKKAILSSLQEVFGKAVARAPPDLAIYKLEHGASMAACGRWWQDVFPKDSCALSEQRISEVLVQVKNWADGSRPRCTKSSYPGKRFVCTLAASLRFMILNQTRANADVLKIKAPNNSADMILSPAVQHPC